MSSLNWTLGGDFDPSSGNEMDLSSVFSPSQDNQTFFYNDAIRGVAAEFVIGNDTDKFRVVSDDSGVSLTQHNAGFAVDFSDNVASVQLSGGDYGDSLTGGSADDSLYGGGRSDTLTGGAGHDTLIGAGGNDMLVSQGDGDLLRGGGGADIFRIDDLTAVSAARIDGFESRDVIDLSGAAHAHGISTFTEVKHFDGHAGEIKASYDAANGHTVFKIDMDGDGKADFRITATGADDSDFSHVEGVAGHGPAAAAPVVAEPAPDAPTHAYDHHSLTDLHDFVV